jgi:outer membrane protein assembly factor BamB
VPRITPACLFLFFFPTVVLADNWPTWRGPNYDGTSNEKDLPTDWGPGKNIVWELKMPGRGSSTPVVWGDRIFVTAMDGDDEVALLCITTDGKELWRRKFPIARGGRTGPRGEGDNATASPSTDGKHVWIFTTAGELVCLDFEGKPVWQWNVQKKYGDFRIQFGMHSTPLLYGDHLYVATLHKGGEWIFKVDKNTGEVVWKIDRHGEGVRGTESPDMYASPMLWHKGDKSLLVVHGNDTTSAHKLDNGMEVWRVSDLNPAHSGAWRFVASPGISEELIVIPTCKNGPTAAIDPQASGTIGAGGPGEKWRLKTTTDVPTPLIHDGLVYICRQDGNLSCYDAATGKPNYTNERTNNTNHRASPVLADGKIYIADRNGVVCVVQTGPTFKLLAKNALQDEFNGTPAISGGRIYLHGFDKLYAIGAK